MAASHLQTNDVDLARDLHELQTHLASIRLDLTSLSPREMPGAHQELGAVVATTEIAANTILDACQIFEKAISDGRLQGDQSLNGALSKIYESCSFQDLTSQRITKVQKILSVIDDRLTSLMDRLGIEPEPEAPPPVEGEAGFEQSLLNGPAMPGAGIDQANIDAMFD